MTAPGREPAGSVHEETARLFTALEGAAAAWSRGQPGEGAGRNRATDGGDTSHLPNTCGTCPLCLALDRLGRSRPEVLDHLTDAVQALAAALAAVTTPSAPAGSDDTAAPAPPASRPRPERIEVTD